MSGPDDDDDEKTVMAWLDPPGDGDKTAAPAPAGDGDKTVVAPLPTPAPPPPAEADDDKTMIMPLPQPGAPKPPEAEADDAEKTTIMPLPVAKPPRAATRAQPTIPPPMPRAEAPRPTVVPLPTAEPPRAEKATPPPAIDDDDRTVIGDIPLDWFDEDGPEAPTAKPSGPGVQDDELDWFDDTPAAAAEDEEKTVFAPLPGYGLAPRAQTAIQRFIPREAWTPEELVEQALLGHGLANALRAASRRARGGLSPANRDQAVRQITQRLRHPKDAFLDDDILTQFRAAVATRIDDLAMSELDDDTPMPDGLSDREQEQWQAMGQGLFVLLRDLERRAGTRPRIGRNTRLHERLVSLGQDPFTGPPPGDLARYDPGRKVPMVRAQFLGFFGPFGAFPLNWTEEVCRWFDNGDSSFVSFVDVFTTRFQELFFRAWSDAHAITQFDHPRDDRFQSYLLSVTGNGTEAMRDRDAVPDTVRARYAGLAAGRVKSPVRLRQILQLHFDGKLTVRIEELVPTWLDFEPDTLSHLGRQAASMGMNMHLGSRVRSVGEKIRIHLEMKSIKDYFRLLPSGEDHAHLRDLVFWYLGEAYEIEAVLWLPEPEVQPAVMGVNAQVGWMACIAPPKGDPDKLVRATEFKLMPPKPGSVQEAAA